MKQQILLLTGGVGGAKLALGLYRTLPANTLTVAVNTGDDFDHIGLRICPDLDTTLYTLAGISNAEQGWGRANESWQCLNTLSELGGDDWFRLGDRDIALHLLRTQALRQGQSLSDFIHQVAAHLNIQANLLPMSNQLVATELLTNEGKLAFQEYFVHRQCQPQIQAIEYAGSNQAKPHKNIAQLLESDTLQAVIIAPSNPFLSIGPILAVHGMRELLQNTKAPVVAISPIIAGDAVKGPTAKIMRELSLESSALSVLHYYGDLLDGFILDDSDKHLQAEISISSLCAQTLMKTIQDKEQLASETLAFCDTIRKAKHRQTSKAKAGTTSNVTG